MAVHAGIGCRRDAGASASLRGRTDGDRRAGNGTPRGYPHAWFFIACVAASLLCAGCFLPTYRQETAASSFSILATRLDPLTGAASPTETIGSVLPETSDGLIRWQSASLADSKRGSIAILSFCDLIPSPEGEKGVYDYADGSHAAAVLSIAETDRLLPLPTASGCYAVGGGLLLLVCADGSIYELGPDGGFTRSPATGIDSHGCMRRAFPSGDSWGLLEVAYEGSPGFIHIHGPGSSPGLCLREYPCALGPPTFMGDSSFVASFRVEEPDQASGSKKGMISVRRIDCLEAAVSELGRFPEPVPPPSEPDLRVYTLAETLPDGIVLDLVSGHMVRLGLDGVEVLRVDGTQFQGFEWLGPVAGSGIAFAFPVDFSELGYSISEVPSADAIAMIGEEGLSLKWRRILEPSAARLVGLLRIPSAVIAITLLPVGVTTVTIKYPFDIAR